MVVVNWNRRDLLHKCLESLVQQALTPNEVIVVDNGSEDGSAEMVEREFAETGLLPVRLIRNQTNRGFCAANNQGIFTASSGFVALLNNDALADTGWLLHLQRAFEGRPDIGMAASKVLSYDDPRRIDKAGHLIYPDGQNRGRGSGELDRGQYDSVEEVLWPDGCAAMYRRAMLLEIGGFDEDFFAYGDDAELGLRARICGWKCLYMPQAVVRHRVGSTLGRFAGRRLELIERNRVLLAAKHFPGSLLWLNGIFYLARIAAGILAGAKGRGEVTHHQGLRGKIRIAVSLVKGDLQALRMLPSMLRKRRQLRLKRKLTPQQVRQLIWRNRITLKQLSEQTV